MRKLIIFILITAILIYAQLQLKTRELIKADDSDFIFTFTSAGDSLQRDSIGSIVTARINTAQTAIETIANDSNIALESRTINRSDSLSTALIAVIADSTGAILDSTRTVLTDSKAYSDALITGFEEVMSDSLANLTRLTFINDATISNPDSIVIEEATGIKLANDTRVKGAMTVSGYFEVDSAYQTIGKMLFADETPVAPVLDGDDTWTRFDGENVLTTWTNGNMTKTSKSLICAVRGFYNVICSASIGCDQASATVHFGIAKNNTVNTYAQAEYTSKDAGDVHSVTVPNKPWLEVGDSLYVMVKSDSQADSLRLKHLNFIISKTH